MGDRPPVREAAQAVSRRLPRILRNRDFPLLWGGGAISAIGDELYGLALMWYVLQATGSALATGSVPAFEFVAELMVGLVAGALVDRWPRKRIMIVTDLVRGGLVSVAATLALIGLLPLWYVYASSFVLSMCGRFFGPSRAAAMPEIVGREQLVQANAFMEMTSSLVSLSGRGAGGAIVAVLGAPLAMAVNAASFFASTACIGLVRFPRVEPRNEGRGTGVKSIAGEVWEGVRFLSGHAVLMPVIVVAVVANFAGGLTTGLVPLLARNQLGGGAAVYGFLLAAVVVGDLAGTSFVAAWGRRVPLGVALIASLVVSGTTSALIAFTSAWPVAAVLFTVEGFMYAASNIPLGTLLQMETPSQMRGRVFTAFRVAVNLGSPLAVFLGAATADVVGLRAVYAASGVLVVLVGAWAWSRRALRDA